MTGDVATAALCSSSLPGPYKPYAADLIKVKLKNQSMYYAGEVPMKATADPDFEGHVYE